MGLPEWNYEQLNKKIEEFLIPILSSVIHLYITLSEYYNGMKLKICKKHFMNNDYLKKKKFIFGICKYQKFIYFHFGICQLVGVENCLFLFEGCF